MNSREVWEKGCTPCNGPDRWLVGVPEPTRLAVLKERAETGACLDCGRDLVGSSRVSPWAICCGPKEQAA